MGFLVSKDAEEQVAGDEVTHALAVGDAFADILQSQSLDFQVTLQDFLDVLANVERVQVLEVRQPTQEEDALDQPVGMAHFFDGFFVFFLAQLGDAPVVQGAGVQEVLVDCCQLVGQLSVKIFDDLRVFSSHSGLHLMNCEL